MDAAPVQDVITRSPVDAMRAALRDGINRYKALKDAPETRALLGAAAVSYIGNRFKTIALIASTTPRRITAPRLEPTGRLRGAFSGAAAAGTAEAAPPALDRVLMSSSPPRSGSADRR